MRAVSPEKVLSKLDHLYLSFSWFSFNFHWGAMPNSCCFRIHGINSMLGTVGSFGVAFVLIKPEFTYPFYTALILVLLTGAIIIVWKVPDTPVTGLEVSHRFPWIESLHNADFRWLLITRALVMLSQYTMGTFIAY